METTGLFNEHSADIKFSSLCSITKDRIESFLPGLWEDLFRVNTTNNNNNKTPTKATSETNLNVENNSETAAESPSPPQSQDSKQPNEASTKVEPPPTTTYQVENEQASAASSNIQAQNKVNHSSTLKPNNNSTFYFINCFIFNKFTKSSTEIKDI